MIARYMQTALLNLIYKIKYWNQKKFCYIFDILDLGEGVG